MMRVRLNSLITRTFVPKLEHRAAVFQLTNFLQLCAMRTCTTTPPTPGAPLMPTTTPAPGHGAVGAGSAGSGLRKVTPCGLSQETLLKLLKEARAKVPGVLYEDSFYKASDPTLNPDTAELIAEFGTDVKDRHHRCSTCGCTIADHAKEGANNSLEAIPGLYEAVRECTITSPACDESSGLRIVTLPEPFVWMAGTTNVLFVRSFYDSVIQNVVEKHQYVLVLGHPGIGKSFFGGYLLRHFLKAGKSVVYVIGEQMYVFDATRKTAYVSTRLFFNMPGPWHKIDTIIFDSRNGSEAPRGRGKEQMIVISSPTLAQYKEFLKQSDPKQCIFPCWTKSEVYTAGRTLGYDVAALEQRYQLFGPIPRLLFNKVGNAEDYILKALVRCIKDGVAGIGDVLNQVGVVDVGVSSALLKVDCRDGHTESSQLTFVSPQIEAAVKAIRAMKKNQTVLDLARHLRALNTEIATGRIVELFILYFFTLPDAVFFKHLAQKINSLGNTLNTVEAYRQLLLNAGSCRMVQLEGAEPWSDSAILIPTDPKFPLIDAMFFVNGQCFMVQVTKKQDHRPSYSAVFHFLREMDKVANTDNAQMWKKTFTGRICMLYLAIDNEGVTSEQKLKVCSNDDFISEGVFLHYKEQLRQQRRPWTKQDAVAALNREVADFWNRVDQFAATSTIADERMLGESVLKCVRRALIAHFLGLHKDSPSLAVPFVGDSL